MKTSINTLLNTSMNVSVIIPAFNVEAYLAEALDSVIAQTYPASEIIVVNDGSTDATLAIANDYATRYPVIQVISQLNAGLSATRNRGLEAATGEVVNFLDADDYWYPQHIEQHIRAFLASPTLMLSFGGVEFVDESRHSLNEFSRSKLTNLTFKDFYLESLAVSGSNLTIRRSIIQKVGGFNTDLTSLEDREFCLHILSHSGFIQGIDAVTVQYRIRNTSLSSSSENLEKNWIKMNQIVRSYSHEITPAIHRFSYAYFLRYLARRGLQIRADPMVSFNLIKKAIVTDWTLLFLEPRRTIATLILSCIRVLRRA